MRHARRIVALFAFIWIALLLAAPVTALGVPLSGLVYAFGSLICHQLPERSFHLAGAQLPVCARCFGLYLGFAIAAWWGGPLRLPPLNRSTLRIAIMLCAIPTAVTWGLEVAGLWAPGNVIRFAAALPLGAVIALTVNYVGCARPLPTGPNRPQVPI